MHCQGIDQPLRLQIITHAAQRNDLHICADLKVSLLADGIHTMSPAEYHAP